MTSILGTGAQPGDIYNEPADHTNTNPRKGGGAKSYQRKETSEPGTQKKSRQ